MFFEELDDVIERHEVEDLNLIRNPYIVGIRNDNFDRWNDKDFYDRFRLSKESVLHILPLIEDHIRHRSERNHAVLPLQQFLVALRFYACGSFQIVLGDFGGLHRTTAGKILKRVTSALVQLRPQFISMPSTNEQMAEVNEQFYKIARFPRVLGAIDCTHIRVQNPGGENAENFRNRKGYFSLNVQAVCDANYKIRDIVCRWPGSSHDSNIFRNSLIRMKFENGEMGTNILLGDSGYPLRSYLLTPINNPQNRSEQYYNECQIKTRTVIERTFGIWKRRFPIVSAGMRNKIPLVQDIIIATAILHNVARDQNEILPLDLQAHEERNNDIEIYRNDHINHARQPFINYFQDMLQ